MRDFMPISCCNVPYKCISKPLVSRLQNVLGNLISPTQSAFVKGRSIADNIPMMQKLIEIIIEMSPLLDVLSR